MKPHSKQNRFAHNIVLAAMLALPFGLAAADDAPAMQSPGAYGGAPGAPGAPANTAAPLPMPPGPGGHMAGGRFGGMPGGPGMMPRGPHGGDGPQGRPGGPEHAGPPPGGPGMPPPPPFLHGLNLTEAQQDKIFAILHGQAPYMREQDKALHKAREALHAMASGGQYDDAKAASLAQAAAQAMSNLELSRVRTGQKLLAVLTAEQRKQAEQRMAAMPQRGPRL